MRHTKMLVAQNPVKVVPLLNRMIYTNIAAYNLQFLDAKPLANSRREFYQTKILRTGLMPIGSNDIIEFKELNSSKILERLRKWRTHSVPLSAAIASASARNFSISNMPKIPR